MNFVTIHAYEADGGIWYGANNCGAVYDDGAPALYRYRLWRIWDRTKPMALFIMLNPSTATHLKLDPTLTRCKNYAIDWKLGGFEVVNLFAFRATDPEEMMSAFDAVGQGNDQIIVERAKAVKAAGGVVVAAWGNHGDHQGRCWHVKTLLMNAGVALHYLKLSKDKKFPSHPLYLKKELRPEHWL